MIIAGPRLFQVRDSDCSLVTLNVLIQYSSFLPRLVLHKAGKISGILTTRLHTVNEKGTIDDRIDDQTLTCSLTLLAYPATTNFRESGWQPLYGC